MPSKIKKKVIQSERPKKKKVLIVDWSFIFTNRMYSIQGSTMPRTRRTELEEITYRVARCMYHAYHFFKPNATILAMDVHGGYWRHSYLSKWYEENVEVYDEGYMKFDGRFWKVDEESGVLQKVNKGDVPFDDLIPQAVLPEEYKKYLPRYKGNRGKQPWSFSFTKQQAYNLSDTLALHISTLLPNTKAVQSVEAEADDIAAVACSRLMDNKKVDADVVLFSGDSDWQQLVAEWDKVSYYDLTKEEYLKRPKDEIKRDLQVKIYSGDNSDCIKGVEYGEKYGCVGRAFAEKIADGLEDTSKIVKKTLVRNKKLIRLDTDVIPKNIVESITIALKDKPVTTDIKSWQELTLHKRERDYIKQQANLFVLDLEVV